MKKILIIGSGFLQTFLIKRANELGYYTITIDKNPNSIGFKFADKYSVIDIVNEEACLNFALSQNIDGVLTAATDYGVLTAAYISEKMDLPGLDYRVAKLIKNKFEVRKILYSHKIDDVKQFFEISNLNDLHKISNCILFPVMVKPCDGSGSKAAKRVDSVSDLKEAIAAALDASLTGKALIEDFIVGKEFGVESFVHKGKVHVLGILDKYMTDPPIYAELGHSMPAQLSIENKVQEVVKKAINLLGVNQGAVNMDILITEDGRVCIIDIGARMGGNLIGSHIIPLATGFDYMGNLIQAALGESVNLKARKLKMVVTRLLALKPGTVKNLPDFEEIKKQYNVEILHSLKEGAIIREYKNNLDSHGYILAEGNDLKLVTRSCEEVKNMIDLNIERVHSLNHKV